MVVVTWNTKENVIRTNVLTKRESGGN